MMKKESVPQEHIISNVDEPNNRIACGGEINQSIIIVLDSNNLLSEMD